MITSNRFEINKKLRFARLTNPYVASIVDYYCLKTPSRILIKSEERLHAPIIDLVEKSDIISLIIGELILLGESFIYNELSEKTSQWTNFRVLNPDFIKVKQDVLGKSATFLVADEKLKAAVSDGNLQTDTVCDNVIFLDRKRDRNNLQNVDKKIIDTVRNNDNICLDDYYVSNLMLKASAYHLRGTSPFLPWLDKFDNEEYCQHMEKILGSKEHPNEARELKFAGMIVGWLNKKVFTPIAQLNNWYSYKNGDKVLFVPEISIL